MAFGLIPACMGRCDPGHVFYNGFFIFILAFVVIIKVNNCWGLYIKGLSVLIVVLCWSFIVPLYRLFYVASPIINNINFIYNHKTDIVNACSFSFIPKQKIDNKISLLYSRYKAPLSPRLPYFIDLLPKEEKVAMPITNGEDVFFHLMAEGRLVNLYFTTTGSIGTHNILRTIEELNDKNPNFLILKKGWENITEPSGWEYIINNVLFSYYPIRPYRNGNLVNLPLVVWILQNYKIYYNDEDYILYKRNID